MRGDYMEVENPGMFPSNLNVMPGHSNPFIPPLLPINILKQIEKNEFVHFEDLLPSTLSVTTSGKHFIDIDVESSVLGSGKKKKRKLLA